MAIVSANGMVMRKVVPVPGCALHLDVTADIMDEFTRLVGANAHALAGLGALERPEQPVAQEIGIHSTAVVLDFDQCKVSLATQDHVDESVIARGFLGVLDE